MLSKHIPNNESEVSTTLFTTSLGVSTTPFLSVIYVVNRLIVNTSQSSNSHSRKFSPRFHFVALKENGSLAAVSQRMAAAMKIAGHFSSEKSATAFLSPPWRRSVLLPCRRIIPSRRSESSLPSRCVAMAVKKNPKRLKHSSPGFSKVIPLYISFSSILI